MIDRFDAVVVGGGPSGALSATRLSQLGWHTALVERGERFRRKACGHCLNVRALSALSKAGLLEAVRAIRVGETRSLRVHRDWDSRLELSLREADTETQESGWIVPRHLLDQLLIDRAAACGVTVFQPAKAGNFLFHRNRNQLELIQDGSRTPVSCGLVIGADGLGSGVARASLPRQSLRIGRKYGFSFEFNPSTNQSLKKQAIEMFIDSNGYLGAVQQNNGAVHIAGLVGDGGARREPIEFARAVGRRFADLSAMGLDRIENARLEGFCAVGPMPWKPDVRSIASDSMALVGDAAGYVEPFTGEGISWALHSADLLAESASDVQPGCWNRACADRYTEMWRQQIASRQRLCRGIAFGLEHSIVEHAAFRIAKRMPYLTRRLIRQAVSM